MDEDKVTVAGESHDMKPLASKTFSVTLKPGSYVLICNFPGHYAGGMQLPFTVTP